MGQTGRPTVITEETVRKLESAFKIGANDSEACHFANISRETYYRHLKEDKVFNDNMTLAKEWPILAMKRTIVQAAVDGDKQSAQWYLERKRKDEFAPRQELTGPEGMPLGYVHSGDMKKLDEGVVETEQLPE